MQKKLAVLFVIFIFGFVFSLRWINLGADPPKNLSSSMGYYSDPGGYAHNARNKILYGQWETDEWNLMYTSPIPHYLTYATFLIFGTGIAQINAVPALFSCLLLFILYFTLKNSLGSRYALLGVMLLGSNYVFTVFSQIAVRVMPMITFVVLSLFFLTRKKNASGRHLFLAGSMCFLAFATKGTFMLVLPAIILGTAFFSFFQASAKVRRPILDLGYFSLGWATVMAVWTWLVYLPHKEIFLEFGGTNVSWLTPGYQTLIRAFWLRPLFYFWELPVLTCLSCLMLLILAYKVFTDPRQVSLLSWICGIWMLSNWVYFAVIDYRAARHFVPVVFPMVILALQGLLAFSRREALGRPRHRPLLFFAFSFCWFIFVISGVVIFISRPLNVQDWQSKSYLVLVLSLGASLILYLVFRYWPKNTRFTLPRRMKIGITVILVMLSLGYNFHSYLGWSLAPRFDRKHISQDLGRAFRDMRLGGLVSMVLALENPYPAHAYKTDYINRGKDFLKKYGITHALLTTHAEEIAGYYRDFPETMQGAEILARYPLWRTYVVLYDLNPQGTPGKENGEIYQGEAFFGENGIPRFDPEARGNLAFVADVSRLGSRLELPAGEYPEGHYRLTYRLKASGVPPEDIRLARIDVRVDHRQRALSQRDLMSKDFDPADTYRECALEFTLSRPQPLTLRFFSTGKALLWFDCVSLHRLEQMD